MSIHTSITAVVADKASFIQYSDQALALSELIPSVAIADAEYHLLPHKYLMYLLRTKIVVCQRIVHHLSAPNSNCTTLRLLEEARILCQFAALDPHMPIENYRAIRLHTTLKQTLTQAQQACYANAQSALLALPDPDQLIPIDDLNPRTLEEVVAYWKSIVSVLQTHYQRYKDHEVIARLFPTLSALIRCIEVLLNRLNQQLAEILQQTTPQTQMSDQSEQLLTLRQLITKMTLMLDNYSKVAKEVREKAITDYLQELVSKTKYFLVKGLLSWQQSLCDQLCDQMQLHEEP